MNKFLVAMGIVGVLTFANAGDSKCGAAVTHTKKPTSKPFLILGQLPHLTGSVKLLWDDEELAFTAEQKKKLLVIRKRTMSGVKALAPQIIALEKKIVEASFAGEKDTVLKEDVSKLASLRAKATMIHLACIYETRQVLSKEQLSIIE